MIESILSTLEKSTALSLEDIIQKTNYSKGSVNATLYLLQRIAGSVKLVEHVNRKKKGVDSVLKYPSVKKWLSELKEGDYVKNSKYTFF